MRRALCLLLVLVGTASIQAQQRPMEIADLFRLKRVGDPQVSPDGKQVVYQVGVVDFDANKSVTNLWIAAADGKTPPRQLTTTAKSDKHPRWSPDGKTILFESNRGGDWQLWTIELGGGEARQLTTISTGANTGIWSRDGKSIAFVSTVYPEFSEKPFKEADALNKKEAEEAEKSPVKARVFSRLFFRHWDSYVEDKRNHLFVMASPSREGGESSPDKNSPPLREGARQEPRNVTPGDRDAYPNSTTFSVGDDFTFSPNSKYLVFTAAPDRDEAWSTNYDICRVPIDNTLTKWETLTKDNKAADNSPRFSPDGKKFAWRAQAKAGYEADKWDILIADCEPDGSFIKQARNVTAAHDYSVGDIAWLPEDQVLFTADVSGRGEIFLVDERQKSLGTLALTQGIATSPSVSLSGTIAFAHASMSQPPEVMVVNNFFPRAPLINVSRANEELLQKLDLARPESVQVKVEGGTMQMWILKPPGFDPAKKWPVVYLVHGGPQSAWEDGWSFRWNPQLWAAQGYVIAMPNPRGSTGFGQKFVDDITNDWGGKCFEDLMKGVDYLEKLPYVDKDRIAAAGGSFGGYMMNWFAVNTPRFKTLITHCSVWNFESMWGTTDELWFDENDHGGLPWEKPEAYAKFSPHKKAGNLGKYKTPMLIIHNDLDFRCPIGQGHELFSALQRQGVPSRFVNFPDEGHWVLKPKNSERWHQEVFAWLKKQVPPGGK